MAHVHLPLEDDVVSWQHCQTHFSKNLLDRTPKKLQPELKVVLTDLYNAPDLNEATARKDQLLERYQEKAPKMVALLDERFDEITAVTSLPEPYRKQNLHQHYGLDSLSGSWTLNISDQ